MTIDNERMQILEMIIKLLAKAQSTEFGPEAEAFNNKAAELMAKHQIKMDEMSDLNKKFDVTERWHTSKELETFDSILINALARFNGIAYMHSTLKGGKTKVKFWFVGRTQDLEAMDYMLDIVKQQRKQAWKEYMAAFRAVHGEKAEPCYIDWRAWWNGYTIGVQNKLSQLEAMRDSKLQEWGLVPVSTSEQAMSWYKEDNKVKTARSGMTVASQAGVTAGESVSIHKGIEKQDDKLQITLK